MRGIMVWSGNDLRLGDLRIEFGADGLNMPSPTFYLRTDIWPHWLAESVDSALVALDASAGIPAALAANDEELIRNLMLAELKASMKAITSSAFAIDAFYAAVKARSPAHPQQDVWRANSTGRAKQVAATLQYHLKITNNQASKELSRRIREIFKFRDWAVHPGSRFQQAVYRKDVDAGVDWHFTAFTGANAAMAVYLAVDTLDAYVTMLDRGPEELAGWKSGSREVMDKVLDAYESSGRLKEVTRHERPSPSSSKTDSQSEAGETAE